MMSKIDKLIALADFVDRHGRQDDANLIDDLITKEAKKGYHKCGLKEETVHNHEQLFENYKKAFDAGCDAVAMVDAIFNQ